MSVFDDLGVMVDGLEDDTAEEFDGDVEEIFRFNVFLTKEQEIEIEVNMQELMVEGVPEFGEAYSFLARTYADLVAECVQILPEKTVLHRMTGDGPGNLLIAPAWVRNKKKVLNTINRLIKPASSPSSQGPPA